MNIRRAIAGALFVAWSAGAAAQAPSAERIARGVFGFGTTARVLMIGAHPDDEDTALIAWLALGRQIETAYLSLTRGDGGQNLIGNELGEALGAIRTQEMLAARRVDGGRQYFTRLFDFGFSKDSAETFNHWPRDLALGDVVRVIRAFRPHVIVSVWSGTPADGHGHHTVAGILARDGYQLASDTVRFPAAEFGAPWSPSKFYLSRRAPGTPSTLRVNTGEFDAVRGRSYAEIAADSRAQHRSQGQGRIPPAGVQWDNLQRVFTRVNADTPAARETSIFDGIDTSWARFASVTLNAAQRAAVDSLPMLARSARAALDLRAPGQVAPTIARAAALLERARVSTRCTFAATSRGCTPEAMDLESSISVAHRRAGAAALATAGVIVDAFADREYLALGDTGTVTLSVVNRGSRAVRVQSMDASGMVGTRDSTGVVVRADSVVNATARFTGILPGSTAWWIDERSGYDFFPEVFWPADGARSTMLNRRGVPSASSVMIPEGDHITSWVDATFDIEGSAFTYRIGPIVQRTQDQVVGEVRRPVVPVQAISVLFDRTTEFARAGEQVDRVIRARVQSMSTQPHKVSLKFNVPAGLTLDSFPQTLSLAPLETRDVNLRVTGRVAEGRFPMTGSATEGRQFYGAGIIPIVYDHIDPIVVTRPTGLWLRGIRTAIPENAKVAYIRGVSDDVAPVLQQLDVRVASFDPDKLATLDLAQFNVVVIGPRAYARTPALADFNERLEAFARGGGTVVVQYGQQEMTRKGMLPFAIEMAQQAQRVTIEDAPVTLVDSTARVLSGPNRIAQADFAGWVQERSLYMPSRADSAWHTVIETHDPGEPPNQNSVLIARVGAGTYVYTTLSLFRQVPAGVDGAIRLFMNLLAAGAARSP